MPVTKETKGLLLMVLGAVIGLPVAFYFPDDSVLAWIGVLIIAIFGIAAITIEKKAT